MMTTTTALLTLPVSARDHMRGSPTALVTLVEYGDFECPVCGLAHGVVEELRRSAGEDLLFVFRHFPLTQIHANALNAAQTAEAAGALRMFWEMHDTLFANQDALDVAHLLAYAASLGINPAAFGRALETRAFEKRVREDFSSGVRSRVTGTPTFFIEGIRYDGLPDLDSLMAVIETVAEQKRRV